MNIDKEKCAAWSEMIMALIKMAKELNNDEAKYIKANFAISYGKLELQELEKDNKKSVYNLKEN